MRSSRILQLLLGAAAGVAAACSGGDDVDEGDAPRTDLLHAGAPGLPGPPSAALSDDDGPDDDGDDDGDDDEYEEDVALADLPQPVLDAVEAALPGLELTSAELEIEAGKTAYCVHGSLDGATFEVEIAPDGTLLEIERD